MSLTPRNRPDVGRSIRLSLGGRRCVWNGRRVDRGRPTPRRRSRANRVGCRHALILPPKPVAHTYGNAVLLGEMSARDASGGIPLQRLDQPLEAGGDIVGPQDHGCALPVRHRLEAVVITGARLGGKTRAVPVQDQIDVDGRARGRRSERLVEAECAVEAHGAVDVTREQNDLRTPEAAYRSSLDQLVPRCNRTRDARISRSYGSGCSPLITKYEPRISPASFER